MTRRAADGSEESITRREYHEIIDKPTEPLELPFEFRQYAEWFWDLSSFRVPVEGGVSPIQPGLLRDWQSEFGVLLDHADKRILVAMDRAYVEGMSKQRDEVMRRERERQK